MHICGALASEGVLSTRSTPSSCRTARDTSGLLNRVGGLGLWILNLEGHPNWMIGSKVTPFVATFFVHDQLWIFWIWNQSTVDNGGVSRGRSLAVGVSDRWKVTCDS